MTRCCAQVQTQGSWFGYHQCPNNASVEEGGKHYCKKHSSAAEVARREKRDQKWQAEQAVRAAKWHREHVLACLFDAVRLARSGEYLRLIQLRHKLLDDGWKADTITEAFEMWATYERMKP